MHSKPPCRYLISVDFRSDAGGISRVARYMDEALNFSKVFSLYGPGGYDKKAGYFAGNRISFVLSVIVGVVFRRPTLLVFDHLGVAGLLSVVPKFLLPKIVIFLHDEEAWKPVSGTHLAALRRASLLLCNSEYTRIRFVNNNPTYAGIARTCLLGGVPEIFAEPTAGPDSRFLPFINQTPYCLFVSRLWKEHTYKGYRELTEAFKLLKESGGDTAALKLIVVGRGNAEQDIRGYIEQHGLSEYVKLYSDVNDRELRNLYAGASAVLLPSTREGFGFVFLEAMYFSKPPIGLQNSPAEEIILHGRTGRLLPNNKPKTLFTVLLDLQNNPGDFATMGLEAKKRYEAMFSKKAFMERLTGLLDAKKLL